MRRRSVGFGCLISERLRLFWSLQGAECGEGLQRRSLSCVVRWGGQRPDSPPHPVAADLCGDQLVKSIQQEMDRPCFVPCPGEGATETLESTKMCCDEFS